MHRMAIIIVVIVLAAGAFGYTAIRDDDSATNEIGELQSQVLDIQNEMSRNPSLAALKKMAIRLDDIRSELSYVSTHHRLASTFFSDVKTNVDEAINLDTRVAIQINQKISSR